MRPVGPYSSHTYWVRRAVVAAVALALVVGLVWWALSRDSGSGGGTAAAVSTTTSSQAKLTGVLASSPSAEPDGSVSAGLDGTAIGPNGAAIDALAGATGQVGATGVTGPTGAEALTSAAMGTPSTAAGGAGTQASAVSGKPAQSPAAGGTTAPAAPAATLPGASLVETTAQAPVTVTVTKQIPASTSPKTPKTTPPPPPSYDARGMLICPDRAITVTATALASSLFVGAQPRLGMTVTNIGKQKCVRDVSGALQIYTVYAANGTRIWSTADCYPGSDHESRDLTAGKKASFIIKWAGTTSAPGKCAPSERKPVAKGKYTLVAQLGALKSKPLPITIR